MSNLISSSFKNTEDLWKVFLYTLKPNVESMLQTNPQAFLFKVVSLTPLQHLS